MFVTNSSAELVAVDRTATDEYRYFETLAFDRISKWYVLTHHNPLHHDQCIQTELVASCRALVQVCNRLKHHIQSIVRLEYKLDMTGSSGCWRAKLLSDVWIPKEPHQHQVEPLIFSTDEVIGIVDQFGRKPIFNAEAIRQIFPAT